MNRNERRAQNKAQAERLFELIDSYNLDNLKLAEQLINGSRALRDMAKRRYYTIIRRIDPSMGGSWSSLARLPRLLYRDDGKFLFEFCEYYKALGACDRVAGIVQAAAEVIFEEIRDLESLNRYLSLGYILEPAAKKIDIYLLSGDLNLENLHLLSSVKELQLHSTPQLAQTLLGLTAHLPQLEIVNCPDCNLEELPAGLGLLSKLRVLGLHGNRVREVRELQSVAPQLETLDLDDNPLAEWPEGLAYCAQLRVLSVNNCGLSSWPSWLQSLQSLTYISTNGNPLRSLPKALFLLPNLRTVNAEAIKLERIELPNQPVEISALSLAKNILKKFPSEVLKMRALSWLSLSRCELKSLPDEIKQLTQLSYLNIDANPLKSLPKTIETLSRLDTIYANYCPLTSLPNLKASSLKRIMAAGLSASVCNALKKHLPDNCYLVS